MLKAKRKKNYDNAIVCKLIWCKRRQNKYTHTKIRFYKPKDRLVNMDIAKNDGQSISVQKILKVLYKHISCKHFSKQLHHHCRLTVSHLAPPLPWGKIKKLCEAFNLFRYQAEQSSNSLQFNRHHIQIYVLQFHHFLSKTNVHGLDCFVSIQKSKVYLSEDRW